MIRKITLALLSLLLITLIITMATGNGFLITAVKRVYLQGNTTANINDHSVFHVNVIKTKNPQALPKSELYNKHPLDNEFKTQLEKFKSAAYLIIKDGQVIHETYMNGYTNRSKTNSFSMAKTVNTMLVGIAIEAGYIDSLEQKITHFLPEFKDDPLAKNATIGHLSLMNSGYEWTEEYYSPFSPTVELVYGSNIEEFLLEGYFSAEPGSFWEYSSASTQLLGIILKRALEQNGIALTLSEFLSEKIWQPLQMNDDALWHTDDADMEMVFCCINTNARNFAKLGMLMLNKGRWNGQQLVPASFIERMIQPQGQSYYGYSTWINQQASPSYFWFSGHLGQYIINIPEYDMVIVRLGETRDTTNNFRKVEVPELIKQALKLAKIGNKS